MQAKKNNMKKRYTKKQICEAIAYWKKQLKKLNESNISESNVSNVTLKMLRDEFNKFVARVVDIQNAQMNGELIDDSFDGFDFQELLDALQAVDYAL